MKPDKTGVIICKKTDRENGMVYEPLLFITHVPHDLTDEELKKKIDLKTLRVDISTCDELLFRADIHATSNEVQEEFEHLHPAFMTIPQISFEMLVTIA